MISGDIVTQFQCDGAGGKTYPIEPRRAGVP
jgi:hypothetical protein